MTRIPACLLAACLLLFAFAAPAAAHGTRLLSATPPDGGRVPGDTAALVARYSAAVQAVGATVTAPSGTTSPIDAVADGAVIRFRLTFAEAGRHVVKWGVPQADGHLIPYTHVLVVTSPPAAPTPAASPPPGPASQLLVGARVTVDRILAWFLY